MADNKQSKDTNDPKSMPHNHPKEPQKEQPKTKMNDDTDEKVVRKGADIENPDQPGPDKKVELDDNPDETKRKIPNMNK